MSTATSSAKDKAVATAKAMAKRASAHYSGAAVSQPQLTAVTAHVRKTMRAGIVRTLGCTERQLRGYAKSELSASDLPDKTREKLAGFNSVYSKPWPRKTAAMLYELHLERKRSKRSTKATPATETVTETA